MPKATRYRLNWRAERQAYELYENSAGQLLKIKPGESEWFDWLDSVPSFTFWGKLGQFTARKESRQWGDHYWYAYHRAGSKISKKYLGRTADLTLAHLEETASLFNNAEAPLLKEATGVSVLASSEDASINPRSPSSIRHDELLTIKLHRPRPHSRLVYRSRLIEHLQQGTEQALVLISAPAGFGKTMLLAQYISESDKPVAWLTLEPEDNDPVRFLAYLIAALKTVDERVGTNALELLHTSQIPQLEPVLALLTNDLMRSLREDIVLMLDDYHVITVESIHSAMTYLVEHLPPQLHLVLATRADPPLPLSRLRARGQLVELRAAELRMNPTEANTFLQTKMGLALSQETVAALEMRTEGWIAGLQLAALSLRGRVDVSAFLAAFTGSHRFILDYLSEEVLSRQPTPLQSFLLHTSILERLTVSLCDAVTDQHGSQEMLEELERANLFLVSLDDERNWYRYHRLFADVLRSHLQDTQPALVPVLHRRAGSWYRERGFIVEAVQHMLAAPDYESAADLLEEHSQTIAMAGQVQLVLGWLNTLPDSLMRARPFLCIHHADLLFHTQQLEAAEDRLQDAERCLTPQLLPEPSNTIRGCVADVRALIARQYGDLSRYIALAQQSLDLLPESEALWRASARMNSAHTYLVSGDVTPATEALIRTAVAHSLSSGDLFQTLAASRLLGRFQALQGRLKEAFFTYEKAIQSVRDQEALRLLRGASVYSFGMGELLCEWNRLDEADELLSDGMEFLARGMQVPPDEVIHGYFTLARLRQGRGVYNQGMTTLESFVQFALQHHYVPGLLAKAAAGRARIALAKGDLAAAVGWAGKSGLSESDAELTYLLEWEYLTLARVYIAKGREDPTGHFLDDALHLLDRWLADAEEKARLNSVLEILILQSLALDVLGERKKALSTLERALTYAAMEGYIRLFVDEGMPMLSLLRQAQAQGINSQYTTTLLSAFGEPASSTSDEPASRAKTLIEPLTEREREVLRLLLEGASNREIAHRLVVSINTVKRHIYNICGKLGVQSRTQIIVKARTLNLL